jgi:hypothetical protein
MSRVNWLGRCLLGFGACLTCASWAQAVEYTEIQNDAFDGVSDASYTGGVFSWSTSDTSGSNILTLYEDNLPVPGTTSNVTLTISGLVFQNFGVLPGPPRAYLTGGNMSLTFDYSNGGPITSHELSGPVSEASIEITASGPGLSTLSGIVNFNSNLGVENLPSSNNWPAIGESTAVALTFAIGADLGAYDTAAGWQNDMPDPQDVTYDTVFSIVPEEHVIPEPVSLALLALGSLLCVRRRRTA